MLVVDLLEAVQIHDDETQAAHVPPRAREFALQPVNQVSAVGKTGQRIGDRQRLDFLAGLLDRADELRTLERGAQDQAQILVDLGIWRAVLEQSQAETLTAE